MSQTKSNIPENSLFMLKSVKWIALNILLPALPMFVKFIVNVFSVSSVAVFELNELLYYNFFICILLCEQINKKQSLLGLFITYFIFLICVGDILLIAFVSTGQQNNIAVWVFAISVAVICACFGSIYVIRKEKAEEERSDLNG